VSFAQDLVEFRNLNRFNDDLGVNDYVYFERHGQEVSRFRLLDNALLPSLRGYS